MAEPNWWETDIPAEAPATLPNPQLPPPGVIYGAPDPEDARKARTETRDVAESGFQNSSDLRREFLKLKPVEEYRASVGAYNAALKTAETPAGDQSLIVSYAKMLDPGSTVREGEFETTANTDREIGKLKARLAKEFGWDGGGLLSPEARNAIRAEIKGLVENRYTPSYQQVREDYTGLAQEYGFKPETVVMRDFIEPYREGIEEYWKKQGAKDPEMAGDVPVGTEVELNMDKWGRDDVFDRAAYLEETYGIKPNDEATIVAFWNENRKNENLTPENAAAWYEQRGFAPPPPEELAQMVENAKAGAQFGGIDTSEAEKAYVENLDKVIAARGTDPESMTGAMGVGAAEGITWGALDEVAGVGGAISALFQAKNPVSGYQAERDLVRREAERAREYAPITTTAAELAGGVASGGLGFRGATTLPQVAKAGGITGSVAGFNYGEGATGSAFGAVAGGAVGAAAAPAISAFAPSVGKFAGRVTERFRNVPENLAVGSRARELARAGQEEDILIPRAMVDPNAANRISRVDASASGGPRLQAGLQKVEDKIEGRVSGLASDADAPDQAVLGDSMQDALDGIRETSRTKASRKYDRADSLADGIRVEPQVGLRAIDEQLAQVSASGERTNSGLIRYLGDLKQDLTQEGGISITALRDLRTNVRGQISERNLTMTDAERRAGIVLDAVSEDIAAGLKGNPEALALYREADQDWRHRSAFVKQIMEKLVGPENNRLGSEATARKLDSWAKGDYKRFRRLWAELGQDEQASMQSYIAEGLGRNNNGVFTADQFLSAVSGKNRKVSDNVLQTVFGDDGFQSIKNLRVIAKGLQDARRPMNSRTSKSGVASNYQDWMWSLAMGGSAGLTGLGGGATSLGTAAMAGAGLAAGKGISTVSQIMSAKMLLSPKITRWLRMAPETTNPKEIDKHFNLLAGIAKAEPALAQDIRVFQDAVMRAANDNPAVAASAAQDQNQE